MKTPLKKRPPRKREPVGRPPKFAEPRRPVTVTLPERTLAQLDDVNQDRARAIVQVTDRFFESDPTPPKPVEVVQIGDGLAVIVVARCAALSRVPWIRTIEIGPGRFLVSIHPGTPIEQLEVEVSDLAESRTLESTREREVLAGLLEVLRSGRRRRVIQKAEILFV